MPEEFTNTDNMQKSDGRTKTSQQHTVFPNSGATMAQAMQRQSKSERELQMLCEHIKSHAAELDVV